MSIVTAGDEKVAKVKESVRECITLLKEVVFEDVWGFEDFSVNYQNDLDEALFKLREVKKLLK